MRDHVRSDMPILRFPCVRFASLWPFDAFNGPDDSHARDQDGPNFEFTYFDGLLARLRQEVPDHEQRFAAYRSLEMPGVINVSGFTPSRKSACRAWTAPIPVRSAPTSSTIFRKRQVFYTTAHPNGKILKMLMRQIAGELGVRQSFWFSGELDSLRRLQIPCTRKWRMRSR